MALAAGDGQQHATTCGDDEIIKFVARLEEIWNHVEFKKDEMEIICQENRKLLKPLPRRQTKSEEKDVSLEMQQGHKYQMADSSENELVELNLINKALEKAEKAWKKHRTTTEPFHTCEVTPEDSIKNQSKEESGSNSQELVTDDTKVGVISEKQLTKALSNVRVSQMKAVYKKAPYKTFDCEQNKTISKSQSKSLSQGTSHSKHSALRDSKHSKDEIKSHSSAKSLQTNSNLLKDGKTYSKMMHSSNENKCSGSFQEKKQNNLKMVKCEEDKKKREFMSDTIIDKTSDSLYVIPQRVKHLHKKNHSLKKKLVKMKEQSKSAESFLHLWETKMRKTPNDEAKLLTQKYKNLSTLLQGLNIPCISDSSSSPEEILEAKISLEYILNSVYDLNDQTESLLKKAKSKSTATVNPHREPVPQIVPKEIWLPPHLLYCPFYQNLKESSLRLHYSNLEELNDYWDQQHNLQESLLSHHLLKNVFEFLLPLLKSHLQQREKIFLYRVLQGFLHSHGKHFPTLIDS